jgi:hypothetical protein
MTPYRHLLMAMDFDRTFTGDVEFWRFFVLMAVKRGHDVICVTGRSPTPTGKLELMTVMGEPTLTLLKDLIFCDHSPKRARTLAQGYKVDIWIDDLPEGVGAADRSVFKSLEEMYPVCETLPVFGKKAVDPLKVWTP